MFFFFCATSGKPWVQYTSFSDAGSPLFRFNPKEKKRLGNKNENFTNRLLQKKKKKRFSPARGFILCISPRRKRRKTKVRLSKDAISIGIQRRFMPPLQIKKKRWFWSLVTGWAGLSFLFFFLAKIAIGIRRILTHQLRRERGPTLPTSPPSFPPSAR